MKQLRLYKIADKLFDYVIFAAKEGTLPKYILDKQHKKNPGANYHKTEKGWYLNKDKEQEQSKVKSQQTVLTPQEQSYVNKFFQESNHKFNSYSFISNLGSFSSARKGAMQQYQVKGTKIQYKVHAFSGSQYGESTNAIKLANLAAWHFNLGKGDYRTKGVLGEKPSDKQLKEYAQYLKRQQQVLKRAGLVTKDGKVRLFRNVGQSLFKYHTDGMNMSNFHEHYGETMQYRGSHIESWTFYPDLSWNGAKIYAEVPIEAVVASFIGRNSIDRFSHMDEKECMICSSLIHQVQLVGKDEHCEEIFKNKYYQDIGQSYELTPQERQEYETLRKSNNPQDKLKMLKHKGLTFNDLKEMAKTENDGQILSQIANSELFNKEILNLLAEKNDKNTLNKVLQKAQESKDLSLLKKLGNSKDEEIQSKAQKTLKTIQEQTIKNQSPFEYKNYVQQTNANPDILDAIYEKNKNIGNDLNKSKYVYQTVKSKNIKPETLEKVLTYYEQGMNLSNMTKIIDKAFENQKITSEMVDKFIAGNIAKAMDENNIKLDNTTIVKMTKFTDLSSQSLSWIVKNCKTYPHDELLQSKNINNDVVDYTINKLIPNNAAYFNELMKNKNLTEDMLNNISSKYKNSEFACKTILEHPNCTFDVCKNIKKNNAENKKIVEMCDNQITEKYKQVSEKISDEEPSPKDIQKMKQLFPESCEGKSMEQLIILFKTLMKRGYWDKASAIPVDTEPQKEQTDIENDEEDDEEIQAYIKKMKGE